MTNNKEPIRGEQELTQHDVMVLFRDAVDKLLKTNIHPKDITFSMVFVAAELGFLSADDKQVVYATLVDSIVQASESVEGLLKETDLVASTEDESRIGLRNQTVH